MKTRVAAALLVVTACARADAAGTVSEIAGRLSEINSGVVWLSVTAMSPDGSRAGFRVEGPFEFDGRDLPEADLEYTQFAGGESETVSFVATGDAAFIEADGQVYEVPADRVMADVPAEDPAFGAVELAAQVGDLPWISLSGRDAGLLEAAVEKSTVEVVADAETQLVRRLSVGVTFAADAPRHLVEALGDSAASDIRLVLEIDAPNEPVEVSRPA